MRFREPRQAPAGDAQALRHQSVDSGRHARDHRDRRRRRWFEDLRGIGRAPGEGQGDDRGEAIRRGVRRSGGQTAVSGDLRIRGGFPLPRQGSTPRDLHPGSLFRMPGLDSRPHRARRGAVQRLPVRQGGRSETSGLAGGRPDGRLHRPFCRRKEARRDPSRLRRHPDGRHRVRRIPPDRHRPSRRVPRSGEEGGSGDCHLLAVHRRNGPRRIPRHPRRERRGRHRRCEDRHLPGGWDPRQVRHRSGREGLREDGRRSVLLPRPGGEGMDAQVPPGRHVRAHSEPRPVHRFRNIRSGPAQGGYERGQEDHRGERRPRCPDTRFRGREPPRRRRRGAQVPGEVTSSSTIRRTPGPCRRDRRP